ncbi:MAG: hypothetical protein ACREQ5_02610 [Candidatus Dormibacteria bacterium]
MGPLAFPPLPPIPVLAELVWWLPAPVDRLLKLPHEPPWPAPPLPPTPVPVAWPPLLPTPLPAT